MTKDEARQVIRLAHAPHASAGQLSTYTSAAKTLAEPPTIAQTIRDAAINWPVYLGDVECIIADGFDDWPANWAKTAHWGCSKEYEFQTRVFLLLVAEALE